MTTPIKPSEEISVRIITSFTVNVMRLELFTSVTVNAMLYGETGNFIEVKTLTLSGQDYLDWNNNDQYLIDKVAEILGFTIITPEPVVPPVIPVEPVVIPVEPVVVTVEPVTVPVEPVVVTVEPVVVPVEPVPVAVEPVTVPVEQVPVAVEPVV